MKREIQKNLVISTGHLPQKEMERINLLDYPYVIDTFPEGAYISLGEEEEDKDKAEECCPEFMEIVQIARKEGCSHIKFDRDKTPYDDLKLFDW